jgi:hypothetical protein
MFDREKFLSILFCVVVLVGLAACHSEPITQTGVKASMIAQLDTNQYTRIKWKDTTMHFETVKEGDTVQMKFSFTNTGNKLLFINDVRPSCGCTVANYPEQPVAPGDTGSITVRFGTGWHPGSQRKLVMVKANTKESVNHKLIFFGEVLPKDNNKKN